jgi:hypothetical protein
MTDVVRPEPASFRDPSGAVFYDGVRVLRGLGPEAAQEWEALSRTRFFPRLMAEGRIVHTVEADAGGSDWVTVLEHERIPFVSHPYEWTFEMLRDAAVVHLEVLLAALDEGFTMKDGYSFNVQWRGASPVFIDVGSFERIGDGGPWAGYRQFCQTFLYPLLLEAHLDVPFQRFLVGHLEGLTPNDMRRLFGNWRLWKRGVFRHVYLQSILEPRVGTSSEDMKEELTKAGYGADLTRVTVSKLLEVVRRLESKRSTSGWSSYRTTCTYTDADERAKQDFVGEVAERLRPNLAWDLGCNDGAYARLVAPHVGSVVAADADDVVVDGLYRSLREPGRPANVLPLVLDLVDPSPGRGWRNTERQAFTERGRPDLVLALALVHHLAIGSNVPLAQVVDWFHDLGGSVVFEFVERHDPMSVRLLSNKPAGVHDSYRTEVFEELLHGRFEVEQRLELPSGSRVLYLAHPRA